MPKARDPNYQQPNPQQSRERERRAWELRIWGATNKEIALELGVSEEGARQIVNRAETKEAAQFEKARGRIRARQFARQESLIRTAKKALDKSLEPHTQIVETTDDTGKVTKATRVVEGAIDTKYAYLILKVDSEQRQLTGTNVEPEANPSGYTIAGLTLAEDLRERREAHEEEERKARLQQPSEEKP